jgi:hypothetical protein
MCVYLLLQKLVQSCAREEEFSKSNSEFRDPEHFSVNQQPIMVKMMMTVDSVPIESEEERAAHEQDEIAALDAVGDYDANATVMLEDVCLKTLPSRL